MWVVDIFLSLLSLIILEIILGIDNVVFLAIMSEKLPAPERKRARRWGLCMAWLMRLGMLSIAFWLTKLTQPLITIANYSISTRALFFFGGGAFLIAKATQEIHGEVERGALEKKKTNPKGVTFYKVVLQIALIDIIFSLDSILTAVGLTNYFGVMVIAITCAIIAMLFASEFVSEFIRKYPTIKMLALSFLILIGMVLVADSFAFHIPRGYVYFAMGFSIAVEGLNLLRLSKNVKKKG